MFKFFATRRIHPILLIPLIAWSMAPTLKATPPGEWFDQITKVIPSKHAIAGQWKNTSDGLRTEAAAGSRIVIPAKLPRQYDFRVEFTRHSGRHSIALFFTSGTGRASFEIDAWSEHLAGIQQISGQDIRHNLTRTSHPPLEKDRRHVAEVRVRRDRVSVLLDNKVLASYQGDGSDLSLLPLWQLPAEATLGLGAYDAETTFHKFELRVVPDHSLGEVASSMKNPSVASPPEPSKHSSDSPSKQRVLIVIADHHFFYREYADPREELERAGFVVEVAAGDRNACHPHPNSGQGANGGVVRPEHSLEEVDPDRYEAIVFSGGWGASMYQHAFQGRYDNHRYNGNASKKQAANRLINQFAKQDKYICGICNGVSVLAWSRVDGMSILAGKRCTAPSIAAPSGIYDGRRASPPIRWHVQRNHGRLVPAGSIGDPRSRADDVMVDGKIITAEDDHSAREAGRQLAKLLSDNAK